MDEEIAEKVIWRKMIPQGRDRVQSQWLVGVMGGLLALESLSALRLMYMTWRNQTSGFGRLDLEIVAVGVVFALVVLGLRAATRAAASFGGIICLVLLWGTRSLDYGVLRSGLAPLMVLFVLTFVSTRAGRRVKAKAGLAEKRRGRNAAQVIANLAVAALSVADLAFLLLNGGGNVAGDYARRWVYPAMMLMCLAALVEATSDTVSSEIGQAFGGQPVMILGFRQVKTGTDGAVTLVGTTAGVLGGAIVTAVGMWGLRLSFIQSGIAFGAGICGLFFDSLLGATVERRGWIGNDLVNFTSTVLAAALAALVYRMIAFTRWTL